MKEVSTAEEKGHDVDSTTYLQYIQNKALFSADTSECSAVFVGPSEQNCRLYNHTAICEVISHFIKEKTRRHGVPSPQIASARTRILISSAFPGSLNFLAALFQVNPTHKEVLSAVKVQGHKPYKITPTPPRHVVQQKRFMHYQWFSRLKPKYKNPYIYILYYIIIL